MSIYPLWSALITKRRLSNALIERWFGFLKNNHLNGAKFLSPSTFIRKVRAHVNKISKEASLGINKCNLASVPKKKKRNVSHQSDDEINNALEQWDRKPRPKFSYFSGQYLRFLPKDITKKDITNP